MTPLRSRPSPRRAPGGASRAVGFTAVELTVVMAILAILAALAAPSFNALIDRWRILDAREALTSSLFLARSEAIKRGGQVVLEKTALGADCPQANTAQEWSCGWFVYLDVNNNGSYQSTGATPDVVLQTFAAPRSTNVMEGAANIRYVFDRWGNPGMGAISFVLSPYPAGVSSSATSTLCVTSGGRMKYLQGSATC